MPRPTDEDIADSILRSRGWRQTRRFKFIPEKQSQYITEFVTQHLHTLVWIPHEELVIRIEAVAHIVRSRMALKAAQTRKKRRKAEEKKRAAECQLELFG
ncbi:MAG TPA: hypothetical protein VMR46_00720 [Candidatus Paceibacterota bacterium]|nr:hypothetical protein [Candidatus Paceibacterota bacterium]